MKEQETNIEALIQDDKNFNRGTEEGQRLMNQSLERFGAGRSILIDQNNRIIAGNKTAKTYEALGRKKVRIIETTGDELIAVKRTDIDLDSPEGRELALADNATAKANLEWDEEVLAQVAQEQGIVLDDWNIEAEVSVEPEENTTEEDNFDIDQEVETICKTGDIWQLGEHRLMCGDSTKAQDVERLMNGEEADLWLTDPPYNVDYSAGKDAVNYAAHGIHLKHKEIENDVMSEDAFDAFLRDAFTAAESQLKAGGSFYVWTPQGHVLTQFARALDVVGLEFRQQIQWVKNALVLGRSDYQWIHEPCFYGWKPGAAHYFRDVRNETTVIPDAEEINIDKLKKDEMRDLLHKILDSKVETSVIHENKPAKSELHPTMKPVRLFGRLVNNSSRKGEIVLDTFAGSGTTIVACEQLGRKARLMELDPHYCDVIIARWEKLTGQKAVKL